MKSLHTSRRFGYSTIVVLCIVCTLALIKSATSSAQEERSSGEARTIQTSTGGSDVLERLIAPDAPRTKSPTGTAAIIPSQVEAGANLLVPTIAATMVDTIFTDVDGDGRADPGDTLEYTVVISNTGTDATGVNFTDTIDARTTLVGGSVNSSPIAFDDPGYTAAGNVRITISAASGVLANDIDPDTGNNTGLTASAGATSANGGNVAMSANGGFSYNPAPGFTGTDTFTYTVTDAGGATGTGTVTFNVSGMIWFINAAAGGGGDGRLTTPFNCFVGAGCYNGSANDPGDNIFLYSGAYTGGLTLKANQRVIGQGAGASLSTITGITPPTGSDALPSTGGARPTVTTTIAATSAFTLASGNTFRGFNIGNTTGVDIVGSAFGTFAASEIELNGTGRLLDLTNGTLAATFGNLTSSSAPSGMGINLATVGGTLTVTGVTSIAGAGTQGISVSGSSVAANFGTSTTVGATTQGILVGTSTGNISFGNTSVTAGTDGVSLQNNSSGTRTFGNLSTTNGSGVGFLHAVGGGLTNVTGTAAFTNPGGRCIDIQNAAAGNGVTFADVDATQCGGTGVFLNANAGAITFAKLSSSPDSGQRGLQATSNTGTITSTSGTITATNAIAVDIVGTSAATRTPLNMQLTSVSALASAGNPSNGILLQNTSSSGAPGGFRVLGNGGTCTVATPTCTGGRVQSTVGADGALAGIGVRMENVASVVLTRMRIDNHQNFAIRGLSVAGFTLDTSLIDGTNGTSQTVDDSAVYFTELTGSASVTNTTITNGYEFLLYVLNTSGSLNRLTIDGCTLNGNNTTNGDDALHLEAFNAAVMNVTVTNSFFTSARGDIVNVNGANTSNVDLVFRGNKISNNHANVLSGGGGLTISTGGAGSNTTFTYDISCNTFRDSKGHALNLFRGSGAGTMSGTIFNNIFGATGVLLSGSSQASTIALSANGGSTHTSLIKNNTFREYNEAGINATANSGNSTMNLTVIGNTSDAPPVGGAGVFAFAALFVEVGALPGDTNIVNLKVGGAGGEANNFSDGDPFNFSDVNYSRIAGAGTTFNLSRGVSGSNDPVAITQANNPTGPPTVSFAGTITPVNTVPALPAAINEACSPPPFTAGIERIDIGSNSAVFDTTQPFALLDITDHAFDSLMAKVHSDTTAVNSPTSNVTSDTSNVSVAIPVWQPSLFASLNNKAGNSNSEKPMLAHGRRQEGKRQEGRVKPNTNGTVPTTEDTVEGPDSGETITINGGGPGFTLPGGKSITIKFRVTIDNVQPAVTQVSNQGTVSGSNFANVLTDDPNVVGAANPTVRLVDNTTVAIASNANPSVFGQNVTFTATMTGVPSRASDPPGTVQFKADGNNIGAAVPVVIGAVGDNVSTAQASISSLTVATHVITAVYSGGGAGATGYNSNTGTLAGGQIVGKANTTTGLTSSQNPSVFGQSVTFTATVGVTAPGAGTPTGTVQFLDGVTPITGCTSVAVAAGQAQCMTSALAVGNHTITAAYSGDGNFNTSNGSMTGNPQVVNKANTSVGLTSSQNPAPLGTNLTFTATISVTAPGAGTVSGTVQFLDGVTPITGCTAVAVAAGQAQCMTNALTVGNHTISAVYSGDTNFNTSTGNLTGNPQVITGPPTITPTVGLSRRQGSPATNSQIATVTDDVGSPGSIVVTAMTVPPNMTITNIVNTNGNITADLAAGCAAATGNNVIVLKATDGKTLNMTGNLTINVLANTAPTLGNYANSTVVTGCKLILTPDAAPGDNGSVASVMASGGGGFTGTIGVNATTGVVTITNNGPVGGPFTITVTATDNCGTTFQRMFTVTVNNPPTAPTEFDFDGDRKADIAVYRGGATASDPSFWYVLRSSDNMFQPIQFGADSDVIVPGDYNGDGTTEVAVYRPSTNTWFTSTNPATNYGAFQWGVAGDIPVPGQYDADNKTDIAVWRPSNGNWYIAKSTGGSEVRNWGQSGDKPIAADVDGDGKTDLVQYRESSFTFFIQKSGGGTTIQSWGTTGDKLVLADYDGDNKDDIAVFRPSNNFWYILQSTGGTRTEQFGQAGDVPVPADYDNDGKADLAVYRPGTGSWVIFKSCPCTPATTQFGISTDRAIPSAFTP